MSDKQQQLIEAALDSILISVYALDGLSRIAGYKADGHKAVTEALNARIAACMYPDTDVPTDEGELWMAVKKVWRTL